MTPLLNKMNGHLHGHAFDIKWELYDEIDREFIRAFLKWYKNKYNLRRHSQLEEGEKYDAS